MRLLSMRTRFVAFDRPNLAAAAMQGRSFPFSRWAASMRHQELGIKRSLMLYTYTFEASPVLLEPIVARVFEIQTRRRFARLQAFLALHADEVLRWQKEQHGG